MVPEARGIKSQSIKIQAKLGAFGARTAGAARDGSEAIARRRRGERGATGGRRGFVIGSSRQKSGFVSGLRRRCACGKIVAS